MFTIDLEFSINCYIHLKNQPKIYQPYSLHMPQILPTLKISPGLIKRSHLIIFFDLLIGTRNGKIGTRKYFIPDKVRTLRKDACKCFLNCLIFAKLFLRLTTCE
jgi:hypothetical protein